MVPFIIVMVIVLCAVVVVLSFGAIASNRERPITEILEMLESSSGQRTARFALMPHDKEVWQAAQELALRLEQLDQEIAPEDRPEIQDRLVRLLERDFEASENPEQLVRQRLFFVMHATARSGAVQALPLLIGALDRDDADLRREALRALSLMGHVPEARTAIAAITARLSDDETVVQVYACVALTNLASPDDSAAIEALRRAQLGEAKARDLYWNATLTLARLKSALALPAILDMLTRGYWEQQRVHYAVPGGPDVERGLSPQRVDDYLLAALDAAANLRVQEVWDLIERLTRDPSLRVAGRAEQLNRQRGAAIAVDRASAGSQH